MKIPPSLAAGCSFFRTNDPPMNRPVNLCQWLIKKAFDAPPLSQFMENSGGYHPNVFALDSDG